jgi:hypothetical protein
MTSLNVTENGTASNRDSVNQFHAIHFEQGSLAKSTPVGRVVNSVHNPTAYSVNEGKESTRFLFQYGCRTEGQRSGRVAFWNGTAEFCA